MRTRMVGHLRRRPIGPNSLNLSVLYVPTMWRRRECIGWGQVGMGAERDVSGCTRPRALRANVLAAERPRLLAFVPHAPITEKGCCSLHPALYVLS